ncbi:MAG: transglycosylase SLT domain-containing protein [Myxococcota bacterium]
MRRILALTVALGAGPAFGLAQPETTPEAQEAQEVQAGPEAVALARALDERLTVWRSRTRRVYAAHCRHARVGCRARIVAFARLLSEAGRRHGVDPFLLAAMAMKETGFNPFATGGIGERGLVQLHPRGVGSRVRFVRNESYRRYCARRADACQGEVIEAGAELIASTTRTCGNIPDGLGRYNSGICQTTRYSERVLAERQRLLTLAKADVRADAAAFVD